MPIILALRTQEVEIGLPQGQCQCGHYIEFKTGMDYITRTKEGRGGKRGEGEIEISLKKGPIRTGCEK